MTPITLRNLLSIIALSFILTLSGCKKKTDEPVGPTTTPRTVLVYMAANNDLGSRGYDEKDIDEMRTAVVAGGLNNGRLLIYHAATDGTETLCEMDNTGTLNIIKTYNDGYCSINAARMKQVIADVKANAPADDYGLVLWSHSTGWIEDGITESAPKRSFGADNSKKMNVTTLASVLSGQGFSFVYFDCCYMSTIEVAYELRNVTPTIVASVLEVPLEGMPYNKNIPCFFQETPDLIGAATNTFNYYNVLAGENRTCSMTVTNTAGLDALAQATRDIYALAGPVVNYTTVQKFSLDKAYYYSDFGDYIEQLCATLPTGPALLEKWNAALNDVVLYKAATPMLWNTTPIIKHSGFSTYILNKESDATNTSRNYNNLSWYADVAESLFKL